MSAAEDALAFALKANGIDGWEREHCFDRVDESCRWCCPGTASHPHHLPPGRRGFVPGKRKPWVKCKACNGKGFVTVGRKWALDFAFVAEKVACEVDGGGFVRGRHHRPDGFRKDCEKLNTALCAGWLVLRVTPEQVKSGEAVEWIEQALRQRREE